jgi:WD40 repeat protein
MRLWPRTIRGTWLLALAAWIAGCAGVWWLTPVRPRAEWSLSRYCFIIGNLPGGKVLTDIFDDDTFGPIQLWDSTTSLHHDLVQPRRGPSKTVVSPNGRWLAFDSEGESDQLGLIETTTGRLRILNGRIESDMIWAPSLVISLDDRLMAIRSLKSDVSCVEVWSLDPFQLLYEVPNADRPHSFSIDGRLLTFNRAMDQNVNRNLDFLQDYVIWDVERRAVRSQFRKQACGTIESIAPNCSSVIVRYDRGINLGFWYERQCWEVPTGQVRWVCPDTCHGDLIQRGDAFIEESPDKVIVHSARSGEAIQEWPLPSSERMLAVSPDGRFLATKRDVPSDDGLFAAWLEKFRIGWLFPPQLPNQVRLTNLETGQVLSFCRADNSLDQVHFSPDDKFLSFMPETNRIQVWDVPPRKPLTWFAVAAALLALPLAAIAWRRSRHLRREAA